jgi:hypothetical protein
MDRAYCPEHIYECQGCDQLMCEQCLEDCECQQDVSEEEEEEDPPLMNGKSSSSSSSSDSEEDSEPDNAIS